MTGPDVTILTLASSWLHDVDPVAFTVPGVGFAVRWYGLSYVAGFVAGFLMLRRMAKANLFRVPVASGADVLLALIAGTMIGGRLGYVVVYRPSLFLEFDAGVPFWGVLAINQGGMASHGGIVGIVIACALVARHFKIPSMHVFDAACLVAPVGIVFGRRANFINGERLGKVVSPAGEPGPSWAVKYPQELMERRGEAWAALTDAQRNGLADALQPFQPAGFSPVDAEEAATVGVPNAIAALQAGSDAARAALEPFVAARHPTQLYQALAEGLIALVVCWAVFRGRRRPGTVLGWFLISYGVGRVLTEFVRLPDAHLTGARVAGLSRGQWLSIAMVVIGVGVLVWVRRRGAVRFAGWGTPRSERPALEATPEPDAGA